MTRDSRLRTVLVTGGCGFIGTNLIKRLLESGYTLRVLDNFANSCRMWASEHRPLLEGLTEGDIRDTDAVQRAIEGADAVVHLAAHAGVAESFENPRETWDVNVNGTLNLLEACRRNRVGKFILASSNAVVGRQVSPVDEFEVPQPVSPYGASKLAGEALCSAYHHSFGLSTVPLRFANCYGPHSEHKSSVISTFMRCVGQGRPLVIYGDGNQTRDFIHVDDVCHGIHLSLMTPESCGEVFQIASGTETSINEVARMLGETAGVSVQIVHKPKRKGEIESNYSDITKAKKVLGFETKTELSNGLLDLWEQYAGAPNESSSATVGLSQDCV